ncbi:MULTISPECIES: transaldolase family protein [Commensalibacter]|uniref:Fructose-6-phosphate aldolase n=2 Tax=Commensalibacter TaxID=1079922 RepID=W7E5Z0_9PROT|nr:MULTISPECIES: transaldolase family protein [Commensalibacter]EUK18506.1 fructose-6-phosphate aldolase [Commensalibacter papalotli (ex Servin-Garciduenas et al. 2014)]CAI3932589.1 Transaldolase/fructose-6-phosphate aldolase (TalA) (PDB:1F05) [Commensalibacter papalotli (ex Botero et al. 2024)]CAI3943054.1 Transaldolase/fructose-6-phosphate aldolase (TalA) (PDB:1F05) [Commensalibacter papalotli (ex Botero et al. 2024)]
MKILLDTSDVKAIKRISGMFPVWGVTTNPAIVAAGGTPLFDLLPAIRDAMGGKGTLFAQVISPTVEGMIDDAQKLRERVENLVVKVPVTPCGLKVIKELTAQGIPTLATSVYGAAQGLLGLLAGAQYVSPYVSRIDAQGGNGPEVVSELQSLISTHCPEKELVAASFKSPRQALECMLIGCKGITLPVDIFDLFIADPAVGIAVKQFEEKWQNTFHQNNL